TAAPAGAHSQHFRDGSAGLPVPARVVLNATFALVSRKTGSTTTYLRRCGGIHPSAKPGDHWAPQRRLHSVPGYAGIVYPFLQLDWPDSGLRIADGSPHCSPWLCSVRVLLLSLAGIQTFRSGVPQTLRGADADFSSVDDPY